MQERDATLLFKSGELTGAVVKRRGDQAGWTVMLQTIHHETDELVVKHTKKTRIFRTSDAALRWCQKVGFDEVTVYV